jgi:hypothetical protein
MSRSPIGWRLPADRLARSQCAANFFGRLRLGGWRFRPSYLIVQVGRSPKSASGGPNVPWRNRKLCPTRCAGAWPLCCCRLQLNRRLSHFRVRFLQLNRRPFALFLCKRVIRSSKTGHSLTSGLMRAFGPAIPFSPLGLVSAGPERGLANATHEPACPVIGGSGTFSG